MKNLVKRWGGQVLTAGKITRGGRCVIVVGAGQIFSAAEGTDKLKTTREVASRWVKQLARKVQKEGVENTLEEWWRLEKSDGGWMGLMKHRLGNRWSEVVSEDRIPPGARQKLEEVCDEETLRKQHGGYSDKSSRNARQKQTRRKWIPSRQERETSTI